MRADCTSASAVRSFFLILEFFLRCLIDMKNASIFQTSLNWPLCWLVTCCRVICLSVRCWMYCCCCCCSCVTDCCCCCCCSLCSWDCCRFILYQGIANRSNNEVVINCLKWTADLKEISRDLRFMCSSFYLFFFFFQRLVLSPETETKLPMHNDKQTEQITRVGFAFLPRNARNILLAAAA